LVGEDMTVRYESAPGSFRYRCKICGCLTPGKASYLETVSIPAGLFDDDPKVRPRLHVFTSSRAPWWTIQDDLPQHEKWVPGYGPKPSRIRGRPRRPSVAIFRPAASAAAR
jgi:hypothetical protein